MQHGESEIPPDLCSAGLTSTDPPGVDAHPTGLPVRAEVPP
jgi:hypothetical protein